MTRFVRTLDGSIGGELINADRIDRIKSVKVDRDWEAHAIIDGQRAARLFGDVTKIEASLCPVVAAQPGYLVVRCGEDEDGKPWTHRSQIVAWRIDDDRAIPVTLEDDVDGAILAPDGSVTMPYDRIFETEAEWVAEMAARRADERRRAEEPRLTVVETDKGAA